MLDLRRLRLLRELHARGTIAAVADALQFTPSAVSQQLAVLEREAGQPLLERTGRRVRLTDAALVLVAHAEALLERAGRAEADLAAAAGAVTGRARVGAFQSAAHHLAVPAIEVLSATAPALRCELVETEPEDSLPALALGDYDLVVVDEWDNQPLARSPGLDRHDLFADPVRVILPAGHPLAAGGGPVRIGDLRDEPWATGNEDMAWGDVCVRTCRGLGGFDPDVRHRSNDGRVCLRLVASGLAVSLLPDLVRPGDEPGVAVRPIADADVHRTVLAATRTRDRARPSVQALLAAIRAAAERVAPSRP